MFVNILMTIVIAAIAATVAVHFIDVDEDGMDAKQVLKIATESLGVGIGLVILKHVALRHPEFSWLCLIILVAFIIGLMYQWHKQGSDPGEFICFTLLTLIAGGIARVAAANYASATIIPLLAVILLSIFAIGFYGFMAFKFYREVNMLDDDEREALLKEKKNDTVREMDKKVGRFNRLMAAVAVATLIALAGTTGVVLGMADSGYFKGGPDWSANIDGATIAMTDTANAATDTSVDKKDTTDANIVKVFDGAHIHNNDVQNDGDNTNDLNYGLSPEANKSADYYYKEFVQTLSEDPPFLAGTALSLDAELGTNYLDQIQYVGGNEKTNWLDRANGANLILCPNKKLTVRVAQVMEEFLDTVVIKKEVRTAVVSYDQIFMNPHTITGVPGLVCYETEARNSTYLVLTCQLKNGEIHELWYHIPCRYQWSIPDAEKTIGVKPQKKPSNPGNNPGKGDNPTPTPTPTPKPTPTPSYSKKPSDDSVNKGNANKGGGQDKSTDGSGENQPVDPRTEHPTGSGNDNNHGYSDPSTVTPSNPSSTKSEPVVTDSNPMDYKPDPVTNNGPTDSSKKPTSSGGDGEFTPSD